MNIILTIDFSPWSAYSGGAQRSTHNLALALCRRGHDVSVVYTKAPWESVDSPSNLPYTIHWATFFDVRSRRSAPLRPLNAWSVARVVQGLLHRKRDVVVHSNGEEGGMIHRLRRHHHFGFISTPRHPRYPARLLQNKPLSFGSRLWLACTQGKYLMQGKAAQQANLCVPPSAFAADMVHRAFNLGRSQVHVVPNGVPEEFLRYQHNPRAAENGSLVFFGRFEPTKGVDTLVEALYVLGHQAPRTLIIGRGAQKPALQKRIKHIGLDDRVELLPWMSHDTLAQTLSEARMVVLPSREENFSLAILSAMAVGAPVISTLVGGTPEIIQHEQTGLLVEPDAPHALAQAIARLNYNPEWALQLGEAGRDYVRTHLTWDHVAGSFETLYRHTLASSDETTPLPHEALNVVETA